MSCRIDFTWDNEAAVWIATSKDVPGLVLESGSFDALIERVRHAVPELLPLLGSKRFYGSIIGNRYHERCFFCSCTAGIVPGC